MTRDPYGNPPGRPAPGWPIPAPGQAISRPGAPQAVAPARVGPLRVAVIGLGFGATVHIPALQHLPETEVVGVCARRPERAHLIAAQHRIKLVTTDYREMIRHADVDAVIIATPPHLHHAIAITALEAGKHVLLEKPMARSVAEARDLAKMAQTSRVVAMVNHEFRFLPVRLRAKELIDDGFIGEPHSASMTIYRSALNDPQGRPFGWLMEKNKAGGMLGAAGSHHIDALRWWFGEVRAVTGGVTTMVRQRRLADSAGMGTVDADDNFSVVMRFANGAMGTIHYSATAAFDWGEQIMLAGSEGMLVIQGDDRLFGARKRDRTLIEIPVPSTILDDVPEFDNYLTGPTARLIRHWVRAIRGEEAAEPSFDDGVRVQEVIEAIVKPGPGGRWVDIGASRWPGTPGRPG